MFQTGALVLSGVLRSASPAKLRKRKKSNMVGAPSPPFAMVALLVVLDAYLVGVQLVRYKGLSANCLLLEVQFRLSCEVIVHDSIRCPFHPK